MVYFDYVKEGSFDSEGGEERMSKRMLMSAASTLALAGLLVLPATVFAQGLGGPIPTIEGTQTTALPEAVINIVNFVLVLATLAAIVFIIIGGVQYIFSRGDEDAAATAKNTILFAILGLIIIGLAFSITQFIVNAVGIGS